MARGRKKLFENWLTDLEAKRDAELFPVGEKGPCKTCESCLEDSLCGGAHYGKEVDPEDSTVRDCWSIGPLEYADQFVKDKKDAPARTDRPVTSVDWLAHMQGAGSKISL